MIYPNNINYDNNSLTYNTNASLGDDTVESPLIELLILTFL